MKRFWSLVALGVGVLFVASYPDAAASIFNWALDTVKATAIGVGDFVAEVAG